MLFNSYEFVLLFLPLVLGLYYLGATVDKPWISRLILLLSSLVFYAYWDPRYLPLLLSSIGFNYLVGRCILQSSSETRKPWLVIGISVNLLALFAFKYFAFTAQIIEQLFNVAIAIPAITLPLGISFFTFTQIAFLVDAYHQKVEALEPSSYGLFVTVFPHLIAGPILHHRDMIGQFQNNNTYRWNAEHIRQGIVLFTMGLMKKVLIADTLAPLVHNIFDRADFMPTFLDAWGGAIAYTLQLYFDFSGYSDMAIGLGLLFNIHLPMNFDSPYKSQSIIEFWRRWHITLSTFLRDYLYIPLGGGRHSEANKLLNLFLTMLLGGIWHGAGWTFILWGALQGIYLVINHLVRDKIHFPTAISWPLTLIAIIVGWVIFRANDLKGAVTLLQGMVGLNGFLLPKKIVCWLDSLLHSQSLLTIGGSMAFSEIDWLWLSLLLLIVLAMPNSQEIYKHIPPSRTTGIVVACIFVYCVLNFYRVSEFLYYRF